MTLTRVEACRARTTEQEKLAANRLLLSTVCGCTRCGDAPAAERLLTAIHTSENRVTTLTNDIIDWTGVCVP